MRLLGRPWIKHLPLTALLALALGSCTAFDPLADPALRRPVGNGSPPTSGIKVTFLGNSTLHLDDGETSLLIDGFLSRPGMFTTLFGKVGPDRDVIRTELENARITRLDAVLVGHAHHDHSLDATLIAETFGAKAVGSESFANIYRGSRRAGSTREASVIPRQGGSRSFGRFHITFAPSEHVHSHSFVQRAVQGHIAQPLAMPAHYSHFKCGDVFALHIAHPDGNIVITTTAGAKLHQFRGKTADVIFLAVGLLSKETKGEQNFYWHETVEATGAKFIVPVHWDNFSRKLSRGLKPSAIVENPRKLMDLVKSKSVGRQIRVLDRGETVRLAGGQLYSR
jgi:L-ascorbate metabolism protein UlaG (beta-lactamase superfamily)